MTDWDKSVDLLIAGSGGGGMVAALAALDSGIDPLVVEMQDLVGGSTGMSGGMVSLPYNPLMRDEGIHRLVHVVERKGRRAQAQY